MLGHWAFNTDGVELELADHLLHEAASTQLQLSSWTGACAAPFHRQRRLSTDWWAAPRRSLFLNLRKKILSNEL